MSFPALHQILREPLNANGKLWEQARAELQKATELLRTSENHWEHIQVGADNVTQAEWIAAIRACLPPQGVTGSKERT